MMDVSVRCDKPYDLDAMDKRRGRPRRRRKDSHTTAYELTVRLSKEQAALLGKRKYVRVVYARNKRDDLAAQVRAFEEEISGRLREAARLAGEKVEGEGETVGEVVRAYVVSRANVVVSDYVKESLDLAKKYIDPTIGGKTYADLTRDDVETALEAIPGLSRRRNEETRRRQERAREEKRRRQASGEDKSGTHYPEFAKVRVAGLPTQHKVLVLLKLAGQYAMERGYASRNVADDKKLRSQYPKSRPLVDNFYVDEARLIYSEIKRLPLSAKKVQFQLVFMTGLRPCEMGALIFDNVNLRDPSQGVLRVVKHLKTSNAARNIPLDPDTTALLAEWKESRREFARENGVLFSDSWLVCCDDGQRVVYNTFKQRWAYFLKRIGIEHHRPYSMRHTFATMNGGVDPKTLAGLMGHSEPGFTMRVYSGFLESRALPVTTNYLELLSEDEGSPDAGHSRKSERNSR